MEDDERLLYTFVELLLPSAPNGERDGHHRPEGSSAPMQRAWDAIWQKFRPDGTMRWPEFEQFIRPQPKLAPHARRLFDLLDDSSSGVVTTRALLEVRRQYAKLRLFRHSTLDDLRKYIAHRFGTLVRAWRSVFDPDNMGRCGRQSFLGTCKKIGFTGELKQTWIEMMGSNTNAPCTLRELDPAADALLLRFCNSICAKTANVRDGWFALVKAHGQNGRIFRENFELACATMGYNLKEARVLFSHLDGKKNKSANLDEWLFLQIWEGRNAAVGKEPHRSSDSTGQSISQKVRAGDTPSSAGNALEFVVVLTPEEHAEYLSRMQGRGGVPQTPTLASTLLSPALQSQIAASHGDAQEEFRPWDPSSHGSPSGWAQRAGQTNQASLAGLLQQMAASKA